MVSQVKKLDSPTVKARGVGHNASLFLLLLAAMCSLPAAFAATEIKGKVVEVAADTVKIETESGLVPNVGDEVKIFFTPPGSDIEVSVGTARVTEVGPGFVQAKVETTKGKVEKDQLAKIVSDSRQKNITSPGDGGGVPATISPQKSVAASGEGGVPATIAAFAGGLLGLVAAHLLGKVT
jgi:hypothetical protein